MMEKISIKPFNLSIPEPQLHDLQSRLQRTRWPSTETVPGWEQGPPIRDMKYLHRYWMNDYNWKACESWFNSYPQFKASIDGEEIHYLHVVSSQEDALPMLMVHGWPGSTLEFRKVIEPLTNGSSNSDAFHLVIPSLPGYGWSSQPRSAGWNHKRMAHAFSKLMLALGYERWVAQGGDWGADIVALLASDSPPPSLAGIHMNTAFFNAHKEIEETPANEAEALALKKQQHFESIEYGYFLEQGTRPQTMSYLLSDSPIGQAAWIYEKIYKWTQHSGDVLKTLAMNEILDNIMVYWLSNSGGSSAMLYWEDDDNTALPISIPVGVSIFPGDLNYAPRSWGERYYSNIVHWRDVERGGHFAAWEVPDIFVREVRETFRHVR